MPKVLTYKQALKLWLWSILAAVAILAGGHISDALLEGTNPSLLARWMSVAAATLSAIPWILLVGWGISAADEYQRQIALVGTAIAFVANILLYTALGVMRDARIVGETTFIPYLPAAVVLWIVGVGLAAAYYRLRP